MKAVGTSVAAVWLVVLCASGVRPAFAQEAGDEAPPPPEVQRLIELAKDPERIRQVMSDPDKIQEIMTSMESDAVRQFMSDPRRMQQLMREIDPQQIQEAMRSVDFSKVRQAMASRWKTRLKQMLGATDEEWKALEPKLENVIRAQQETRVGIRGGGGFGSAGGRGLPLVPRADRLAEPSKVEEAVADLREAMDDPDLPGAEVSRRLKAYRTARDKARQKLQEAERELKELLTQRQEGILLMAGILS